MPEYNIFEVFSKTAEQLFRDTDLSPAMVYLVDAVNPEALPFLADQFDVSGFKGWMLAATEEQKRELIKTAIAIKRKLGTPYAIKRALLSVGFDKVTIQEGIAMSAGPVSYDGTEIHDGSVMYGGFNWTAFTVTIRTADPAAVSSDTREMVRNLILYYKNARSVLVDVFYLDDDLNYYDGSKTHNGAINYT